jgi:curved DNA-binding protein CbpA
MGNDMSNEISREDFVQIQNKQLLLEEQNRKIQRELKKEKQRKEALKSEINELKTTLTSSSNSSKTNKPQPAIVFPKNNEKVSVTINKSTVKVDPYEIFGLDADCCLTDIKKVYKQLVVKYHPDKSGYDSANDYRAIQKAYAILISIKEEEAKVSGLLIQTIETKNDEREKLDTRIQTTNYGFEPKSGSAFDNKRFNDMFDKTKFVETDEDDGYATWMKEAAHELQQPKLSGYSKDGFNKTFEEHAKQHSSSKQLAQFIEPDSYFNYGGGFENLGEGGADYSSDGKYTDLKKAYSVANILHPGETKPRESYTGINQIKASRDSPIVLTEEERAFLAGKQSRELEHENIRVNRLREKDKRIDEFYTRVHGRTIELPTYKRS